MFTRASDYPHFDIFKDLSAFRNNYSRDLDSKTKVSLTTISCSKSKNIFKDKEYSYNSFIRKPELEIRAGTFIAKGIITVIHTTLIYDVTLLYPRAW